MTFSDGSESVLKYRPFLPCRAWWKSAWSVKIVFPAPGSPAMIVTDPAGIPPPRIVSSAAEPMLSRSRVEAWSAIRRLIAELDAPLAEGRQTSEPIDHDRAGQVDEKHAQRA